VLVRDPAAPGGAKPSPNSSLALIERTEKKCFEERMTFALVKVSVCRRPNVGVVVVGVVPLSWAWSRCGAVAMAISVSNIVVTKQRGGGGESANF
jgi:hypothetical protein